MIDREALFVYDRTETSDLALAHWWTIMKRDGDLETLFARNSRTLGALLTMFQNPARTLMIKRDEHGIWFAAWFEPIMELMTASVWIRKDCRRRPSILRALYDAYDAAFAAFGDLLLGLTRRDLLRTHQRLGYHVVGRIPRAVDGEDGYLVSLTREWYEAAKRRPRVVERQEVSVG